MKRPSMRPLATVPCLLLAIALAGCKPSIGGTACTSSGGGADGGTATGVMCVRTDEPGCDDLAEEQSRLVVYRDGNGEPAYAGQALLLEHCATCHHQGEGIRFGAPAGLEYDPFLVTGTDADTREGQTRHLQRAQNSVHRTREGVYEQVVGGAMPPRNRVLAGESTYTFEDGTRLFGIRDPRAHEILRHWLSCGSPMVESSTAVPVACESDSECTITNFCVIEPTGNSCLGVGDVVPPRATEMLPQWSSIYPGIIATSCAGAACHVGGAAGGLRMDDAASGYDALVGVSPGPMTLSCAGEGAYVIAGDADNSLLIHKVEGVDEAGAAVCGLRMPIGPLLSTEQIDLIRMWIDAGAMED